MPFIKRRVLALLLVALFVVTGAFSGCGNSTTTQASSQPPTTPSAETAATESAEPVAEEKAGLTVGPTGLLKYDPVITVRSVRAAEPGVEFVPDNPDYASYEENIWIRTYEEELGIKIVYDWIVPLDQYNNKMNVTIASGDLPDIMPVAEQQFKMLQDGDQLEDLQPVFDKYVGEDYKSWIELDGGNVLKYCKLGDKLLSIPVVGTQPDNAPMMMIRMDWLENLGLSVPKTFEEMMETAKAFTNGDPDKNGKNDTYGLMASKTLTAAFSGLDGFFNGNQAFLNMWLKDESGGLVYSDIQPEVRDTLVLLQNMYKDGILDKEFAVRDDDKVGSDLVAGKVGIGYGIFWTPLLKINESYAADPTVEWGVYPIPSIDGSMTEVQGTAKPAKFVTVRKGYENPEVPLIIANHTAYTTEKEIKIGKEEIFDGKTMQPHKYVLFEMSKPWKNLVAQQLNKKAAETGDTSGMTETHIETNWGNVEKAMGGDRGFMGFYHVFGPENSTFDVINQYKTNDKIITDAYAAPLTATMVEKGAALVAKRDETFYRIIMGAPIEEFDTFVEVWKKLGGEIITQEVNDWYKNNQ